MCKTWITYPYFLLPPTKGIAIIEIFCYFVQTEFPIFPYDALLYFLGLETMRTSLGVFVVFFQPLSLLVPGPGPNVLACLVSLLLSSDFVMHLNLQLAAACYVPCIL